MARFLYALAFDLDGVGMPQLRDVLHQMNKDILPKASFVVNSGTGLHLYYILSEPVPMYPQNQHSPPLPSHYPPFIPIWILLLCFSQGHTALSQNPLQLLPFPVRWVLRRMNYDRTPILSFCLMMK